MPGQVVSGLMFDCGNRPSILKTERDIIHSVPGGRHCQVSMQGASNICGNHFEKSLRNPSLTTPRWLIRFVVLHTLNVQFSFNC